MSPEDGVNCTPTSAIAAYRDNILIEACGPIFSRAKWLRHLTHLPERPNVSRQLGPEATIHQALGLRALYTPSLEALQIAGLIDQMIRQSYVDRNPKSPATWQGIYPNQPIRPPRTVPPIAAFVTGVSGTGKSTAIERALSRFPQVIEHKKFPTMKSPLKQLVHLKINIPPSGSAIDFVDALWDATEAALGEQRPDFGSSRPRRSFREFSLWERFTRAHFLGLLCLDEIQNLFKLETLRGRTTAKARGEGVELRIKDDEALKLILHVLNEGSFSTLAAGTPDGMAVFASRFSTGQRLSTLGFTTLPFADNPDSHFYADVLLPALEPYQWTRTKLRCDPEFRKIHHALTAGIPRVLVASWFLVEARAISRGAHTISIDDFKAVMRRELSPIAPAISALLSGEPGQQQRYEDLLPLDPSFWSTLFGSHRL